jgi:putative inorganic carbon (HCO3(-)) transporter
MRARIGDLGTPAVLVVGLSVSIAIAYATARSPVLAAAALVGAVLVVVVVAEAKLVLLALVAALPWEDSLPYPSATISAVKVLGALLLLAYLLRAFGRSEELKVPPTALIAIVLGVIVGVSLLFSSDPSAGFQKMTRFALFIGFFFLVVQLTDNRREVVRIMRVIALSGTAAAAWALWNFLVLGSTERAGGPIHDPNDFAFFTLALLPMVGYLLVSERSRRLLWGGCFVLLVAALGATFSRGALVGVAVLALWALATRRVPIRGLVAGVAAALGVILLALTLFGSVIDVRLTAKQHIAQKNVDTREAYWSAALRMAEDRPLTGVGPGQFGVESVRYVRNAPLSLRNPVVHNTYLEILAELGAVGLLAFLLYLLGTWRLLHTAYRRSRDRHDLDGRRLATALQASLLVAMAAALFLSEELAAPFWLLGALAIVVGQPGRDEGGAPVEALTPAERVRT